jgi:hypothetical protein
MKVLDSLPAALARAGVSRAADIVGSLQTEKL